MNRACLIGAAAAALLSPALSAAQLPPWSGGTGAGYESYRFGDADAVGIRSLSLFTVPFGARSTVWEEVEVEIGGAFARGSLTAADGSSSSISGLTDTEVRVSSPVADGVILTAVAALPTGHASHTQEEAAVAGALAADLLPFRVSHWGSGGGLGLNAAYAREVNGYGLGVSAGYSMAGEFNPITSQGVGYRPGNELRLRAVVDRNVGPAAKASLQLTVQRYGDDRFAGENLYRSGNRYQAIGSYAFAVGYGANAVAYGGVLHRSRGAFLGDIQEAPAQDLFLLGGGARMPFRQGMLLPSVDLRLFRTADGLGQGFTTGVGTSAEWPAGRVTLAPTVRARFGRLLANENASSGFTGLDLGMFVRHGAGR